MTLVGKELAYLFNLFFSEKKQKIEDIKKNVRDAILVRSFLVFCPVWLHFLFVHKNLWATLLRYLVLIAYMPIATL